MYKNLGCKFKPFSLEKNAFREKRKNLEIGKI